MIRCPFSTQQFLKHDEEAVERPPENEVPGSAVPQAGKQETHPEVEIRPALPPAVASQGYIEIAFDESAQGHVPAAPEFSDGAGNIGVVEIFRKLEAHDPTQADGHIGIAREIEIQLQGISQDAYPCRSRVDGTKVGGETGVGLLGDDIGDENLFGQADDKTVKTLQTFRRRTLAMTQLLFHLVVAHDRTRNQLGKHDDIHHVVGQFVHGFYLSTIGIQHIGDRLEGEKGDADRKDNTGQLDATTMKQSQDGIDVVHKKIGVFEPHQQPQIQDDGKGTQPFGTWRMDGMERALVRFPLAPFDHRLDKEKRDDGGSQQDQDELRTAVGIEDDGKNQYDIVSPPVWTKEIAQQENRQEIEQEDVTAENHRSVRYWFATTVKSRNCISDWLLFHKKTFKSFPLTRSVKERK